MSKETLNIKKRVNPFVMIDRNIAEDERISWRAKGILMYLLSKPNGWKVNVFDLIKKSTDGEHSIKQGLKELKKYGYYNKIPVRKNGKIVRWESYIYEYPEDNPDFNKNTEEKSENEENGLNKPSLPQGEIQLVENLLVENHLRSNKELSNKDNSNISSRATHDDVPPSEQNKEQGQEQEQTEKPEYKKVIDYLNEKLGTKYKHKSKANRKLIKARYSEGFVFDDFKKVIDKKHDEWINYVTKDGVVMAKYLRPDTLFSNKFESYLNEIETKTSSKGNSTNKGGYIDWQSLP